MNPVTALDIIRLALKLAGVLAIGQDAQAEDSNDCLRLLNSMLSIWSQNRLMVYHLVDIAAQSTGSASYTVGPGGDFDVARPDRLQAAYARLLQEVPSGSGPVDFPLGIIETYEGYAAIAIKSLKSFPTAVFYDAQMPLGIVRVWPIPSDLFEIHLIVKTPLTAFPSLTAPMVFPPEYQEAILYNLAGRIAILYQLPINSAVVALANGALNTIRVANHRVGTLMMPAALSLHGGWALHGVGGVTEGTFTLDNDVLGPA